MSTTQAVRSIGGVSFGKVGYGMMSLAMPWNNIDEAQAVELLKHAFDNGTNVWNGSTHYGTPEANSLHLVKAYFDKYPQDADRVFVTMKGSYTHAAGPDGSPEGVRAAVDNAVEILAGVKKLDIFAVGRVDKTVPVEATIRTLGELVKEGKIGGIGLSEVSAATIREAHAVHPITTVEIEMSLFTPDPLRNGIVEACRELGISMVAYSPIGRGWLTNDFRDMKNLPDTDYRRKALARFQPEVVDQNAKLVEAVESIAKRKGLSLSQIALGWVCAQGAVPIPGTSKKGRLEENCAVPSLTREELGELETIIRANPILGGRYGGSHEDMLNG